MAGLKQKLLCEYTENTLNGKISTESVYIAVNEWKNNLDSFYLHYMV
jgi:hypothetical protein